MKELHDCVCIFDLDGTLVDSAPDLTAALNRALLREGMQEIDETQVRGLVGEGARALLTRGFAMQDRTFPDGPAGDRLVLEYIEDYAQHIFDRSEVFPGVLGALEQLQGIGAALAVCTNKTERLSEPLLREAGLTSYFSEILSADSLAEKKPSPLPLKTIMERTARPKAIMVGDTATDLKAAEAADIPCLIATFGYGADDPSLSKATTFDSFKQLPLLIQEQVEPHA